ncbi:DUF3530 family protein [Pseudoalteromonas sp. MMG010]|uniref:DUF3530 family protein n=1 Tax=Pseudoalteromonas sp. MMG010 TaxID=2822685 RepID=UPI001B3A6729|nr:DUF3530 family protein [Pseudoalteromonas sp. MMG010]MBQ4832881.1 DUF3530 family protein [Pseudoalteromonas sp. MMG010]
MIWDKLKTLFVFTLLVLSLPLLAMDYTIPTPYSNLEKNDVERLLAHDNIKYLSANDTEFVSIYSEYMSAQFKGVVLLIPDWEKSPMNNAGINFLRKNLNQLGYTTYAMAVPDINWNASKKKTTTEQLDPIASTEKPASNNQPNNADAQEGNTPEQEEVATQPHYVDAIPNMSNTILDDYKKQLITRYESLHTHAMLSQPENLIVIAQGASAGALIEYYANFPNTNINAFVSLSSYLPNTERNQSLNQTTSLISPALLDIFYSNDNEAIIDGFKDRQRWVNRNSKFDYRQRELFGLSNQPDQQQRLIKEIDGFLRRLF